MLQHMLDDFMACELGILIISEKPAEGIWQNLLKTLQSLLKIPIPRKKSQLNKDHILGPAGPTSAGPSCALAPPRVPPPPASASAHHRTARKSTPITRRAQPPVTPPIH